MVGDPKVYHFVLNNKSEFKFYIQIITCLKKISNFINFINFAVKMFYNSLMFPHLNTPDPMGTIDNPKLRYHDYIRG